MRFAVISDIHSNVFALQAVLADAKRQGAQQLINLGDILYGPIAPQATYDLLRAHDILTIRGNQDRQIEAATTADLAANPTLAFIWQDLPEEALVWLRQLPGDAQVGEAVYACHGSPGQDTVYLLEQIEHGQLQARADADIRALLAGVSASLVLCGHSHLPRTVQLANGQIIVNPGSVGLPAYRDDEPVAHVVQNFSPHARYALVEASGDGWQVQHHHIAYDHHAAAAAARQRQRPDWAAALLIGRI